MTSAGGDRKRAIERGRNKRGVIFALVTNGQTFEVWKRCANYSGHVRGGLRYTWRYVKQGLTEDAARALYQRRLGGSQP